MLAILPSKIKKRFHIQKPSSLLLCLVENEHCICLIVPYWRVIITLGQRKNIFCFVRTNT